MDVSHTLGHLEEELDIFLSMKSSSIQIYDLIEALPSL